MRTVSVEMARKLKDAGLQWEPKIGDWYYFDLFGVFLLNEKPNVLFPKSDATWLPTLSDLLEWLEGRGYEWTMYTTEHSDDGIDYKHGYVFQLEQVCLTEPFVANTCENAAAKAVLWVLEQEATNMGRR